MNQTKDPAQPVGGVREGDEEQTTGRDERDAVPIDSPLCDRLAQIAERLAGFRKKDHMTKYREIERLLPQITQAQEKGASLKALVDMLRQGGLRIAPNTLRMYLARMRGQALERSRQARKRRPLRRDEGPP
jgi:hypothetical protein